MFRCGIVKKSGEVYAKNFPTKEKCETFILEESEKYELKKAIILEKGTIKNREVINF